MHNTEPHVFTRCARLRDAAALKCAGAAVVAALVEAMADDFVTDLGARAVQRARVRAKLYEEVQI